MCGNKNCFPATSNSMMSVYRYPKLTSELLRNTKYYKSLSGDLSDRYYLVWGQNSNKN